MNRRLFLNTLAATSASLVRLPLAQGALPKMKITRVRVYEPPNPNPLFNQSDMVVTVETDAGITGIGEGGSPDTLEQCAGRLIGQDPQLHRAPLAGHDAGLFLSAGPREDRRDRRARPGAVGHQRQGAGICRCTQLLGGMVRNFCECYNTAGIIPGIKPGMSIKDRAQRDDGSRISRFRMDAASTPTNTPLQHARAGESDFRSIARRRARASARTAIGVSISTSGSISPMPLRGCDLIQNLAPYFVEDPVRAEAFLEDLPILRQHVKVPLAAGEEWGYRWDFNKLVENHDIDYVRATLPNVGGITEMMKIAAICETHFVGIVPHFTGPIATAALVNASERFPDRC